MPNMQSVCALPRFRISTKKIVIKEEEYKSEEKNKQSTKETDTSSS